MALASVAGMTLLLGAFLDAATFLEPPSREFAAEHNLVAAMRALEKRDGGVLFERITNLRGQTPEELVVRMSQADLERIAAGEDYVVGYTLMRRDPRGRSREMQVDPLGARLLEIPAVGPALMEDTPWMRSLVTVVPAEGVAGSADLIDAIVGQVVRPDVMSRRLVLAELALRPELAIEFSETELLVLRQQMEGGTLEPRAIEYMLRGLVNLPAAPQHAWLAEQCRSILRRQSIDLDLGSGVPAMVHTTIRVLGSRGIAADARLMPPHLGSNNPAVGRAALEAMASLDPVLARSAAAAALEGELHQDVRRALGIFLAGGDPSY